MPTIADAQKLASDLYDKGTHDPAALASAIGIALGPAGVLIAPTVAAATIAAKAAKTVTAVPAAVADLGGAVRDAADLPTRVIKWSTDSGTWVRIAYVVGGLVLVTVAVSTFVGEEAVGAVGKTTKFANKVSGS